MNLFEIMMLDLILIIFPILIYFIYTIYSKTIDVKINNLFFDFTIFSSYYLFLKLGNSMYLNFPIIIIDVLLILLCLKKRNTSIILLSLLIIYYYYDLININILILIIEYLMYYLIYLFRNSKLSNMLYINIIIIMKIFISSLYLKLNLNLLLIYIVFIIFTNIILFLYEKIDSTFNLYNELQIIEKEKRIKTSLFKITHEIKNPIAVCKGYLDMFDINNKEHSKKYIPIIKSEIDRVLYLLEDFLSITKIKIEKEEMDLNILLEDTINSLKPIINNKNIKLNTKIDDDEIYIDGDYNRLKQALVNIIKNSLESIYKDGEIKIYTKKDNDYIKIYIEDNGLGMTEEELSKLKEAFFTTKQNGTGLGVYLSNEIIEQHSGTLEYFSKKNSGTKVIISLLI